jgi:hypothetical protein
MKRLPVGRIRTLEIKLDSDDMKRLEALHKPHPVIGRE